MSVPEAAACLGVTESTGYRLVNAGEFPVRVLRLGRQWRVPTAEVRRELGLPIEPAAEAASA
ncbi:MAG: helix-turn-helix domain-containing protein [Pseudonocardiaceae bacterium]